MRIIAPMMILIMLTSTLAGCTGGDPDGEEIDLGISDEVLEQLQLQLDENLTKIIESELLITQLQEQLAENSSRINELENNSHEHSDNYTTNEDINAAPIIYRGPSSGNGDMTYIGASAIDLDGEVVRFGIDIDLDGLIDYDFSSPLINGAGNEITFEVNYSLMTMYSVEWDSSLGNELENRMGYDGCYLMANIIAIDDEGKSSTHPEVWNRDCE
ncbi:MAG: hypothetical protein HOJ39_01450 [Euryarchaeota archaeon]|jgi:hypothetical protein|nr:hypothetical protein [Euryarchaeota archaeon]